MYDLNCKWFLVPAFLAKCLENGQFSSEVVSWKHVCMSWVQCMQTPETYTIKKHLFIQLLMVSVTVLLSLLVQELLPYKDNTRKVMCI